MTDIQTRIEQLRKRYTPHPIVSVSDGEEIWYCGERYGSYIGWTPRERAERNGWEADLTPGDPEVIALLDAIEATND